MLSLLNQKLLSASGFEKIEITFRERETERETERDRERQRAKESAEREGREDCTAIVDELLVLEEHNICANLIQKGSSKR
jgi:hypothetical protein